MYLFMSALNQQAHNKVVIGEEEGFIELRDYRKAISKSSSGSSFGKPTSRNKGTFRSSSGSSYDKPTSALVWEARARTHSQLWHENTQLQARVEHLQREVSELKEAGTSEQKTAEKYFEQVTTSTKMVSDAEEREKRLKMEKAKLERKLKEAEEVAAQAETAVAQVHTMPYSTVCGCMYMYMSIHAYIHVHVVGG